MNSVLKETLMNIAEVKMQKSDGNQGPEHLRIEFLSKGQRLLRLFFVSLFISIMVMIDVPVHGMGNNHSAAMNCDIHNNTCTQKLAETVVVLDVSPKPVKAMTDLKFRISLKGKQPADSPYIDLGMPGMKMGPNRVSLRVLEQGVYQGTGIIVRCPSGKRIWKATVTLPDMGSVEFIFDVIY